MLGIGPLPPERRAAAAAAVAAAIAERDGSRGEVVDFPLILKEFFLLPFLFLSPSVMGNLFVISGKKKESYIARSLWLNLMP